MNRVEQIGDCTLYQGDCLEILPTISPVDAVVTDPPYGVTSLEWDNMIIGWTELLKTNALWCFGSMSFFMKNDFSPWKYAQEIIWEKHNGSIFHADRFRRVHEIAVMFYKGSWGELYHSTPKTLDASKKTVRRKKRPQHSGGIGESVYMSSDGGPRLQRSVIYEKSCHGFAQHPTQKPVPIISPLIQYSVPDHGVCLDPFMGSGTTGVACVNLNRKFIGIEIDEKYFEIALARIEAAYKSKPILLELAEKAKLEQGVLP